MSNSMDTYENPTEHKNNVITVEQKDLPDFEEGDWEKSSLEIVKSDLLRSLRKLHRKQVEGHRQVVEIRNEVAGYVFALGRLVV